MNRAMLLCLITHQLQSFVSRVLLGFLFVSTAAATDDVRVEQNLKDKMLVVVGSRFALELVFNLFARVLLNNFL